MQVIFSGILMALLSFCACAESDRIHLGETIYRQGILPSGAKLVGTRENDINAEGIGAACVSCHRRSGLGTQEGRYVIPPIIGKYLFRTSAKNIEDMNLPHVVGNQSARVAYTDATLAQAIRSGINAEGKPLNYLMPRYKLDDANMAILVDYLKQLTSGPVPGVTDDTIHFATIITPDVSPETRQAMVNVLNQFFIDKNSFIRGGVRPMRTSKEVMYRVNRKWQLHIWDLSGTPDTWEQQLKEKLKTEPVYAVISGLGAKTWEPIHKFCEGEAIPCLFPNVDLPVVAENDFYPVYFSKGVLLEAQLISHQLQENHSKTGLPRIVQIYRQGDIGEAAAKKFRTELSELHPNIVDRPLGSNVSTLDIQNAVQSIDSKDVLVLWLRPGDIQLLPPNKQEVNEVYFSGIMGGLESAPIPTSWRSIAHIAYPFDLPNVRKVRMNYPLTWLKIKGIPIVNERVQSDTYLACGILAETLSEMLDSFVRDYLVERVEVMLSHRVITGYYPRFGLAPGQRFASKGGYIAHYSGENDLLLTAEGDWIVP